MTCYSRERLPEHGWGEFEQMRRVQATRIVGPFKVWTETGLERCEDGWLVVDTDSGEVSAVPAEENVGDYLGDCPKPIIQRVDLWDSLFEGAESW